MNGNALLTKSSNLFLLSLTALFFLLPTVLVYAQSTPPASPQVTQAGRVSISANASNTNHNESYVPVYVPFAVALLGVAFGIVTGRIDWKFQNLIQIHMDLALGLFSFILWAFMAYNENTIILLNSNRELKFTWVFFFLICDVFLIAFSIIFSTRRRFATERAKFDTELVKQAAEKRAIHDIKNLFNNQQSVDENQLDEAVENSIIMLREHPLGIPTQPIQEPDNQQVPGLTQETTRLGKFGKGTIPDLALCVCTLIFLILPIWLSTPYQMPPPPQTPTPCPVDYRASIAYHSPAHNWDLFYFDDFSAANDNDARIKAENRFRINNPNHNLVIDWTRSVIGPYKEPPVQATNDPVNEQK
jgi:hypothetical protein